MTWINSKIKEFLRVFFLALFLALIPFIIEQAFRKIFSFSPWPFALGVVVLIIYLFISLGGIVGGRYLENISIVREKIKYLSFIFLIFLFCFSFIIVLKNFHTSWKENYWIIRSGLIVGLIVIIAYYSYFAPQRYYDILFNLGTIFLWFSWIILSPESIAPVVGFYVSELRFSLCHIFYLLIIAYLVDRSLRKVKFFHISFIFLVFFLIWFGITISSPKSFVKEEKESKKENNSLNLSLGKPHLIIIVLDTVRKDHLSLYGYSRRTTPFLEELAQESLVFTNVQSTSSWTLPAHASLFTGLYPHDHGAHRFSHSHGLPLSSSYTTLAEILRNQGYRTAGISANFAYVNKEFGLHQGFEYFFSSYQPNYLLLCKSDFLRILLNTGLGIKIISRISTLSFYDFLYSYYRPYFSGAEIISMAEKWFSKNCQGYSPCFLFLNLMEAHSPYLPPPEYAQIFAPPLTLNYWGKPSLIFHLSEKRYYQIISQRDFLTKEEKYLFNALYDEELLHLDTVIKDFIIWLKREGYFNNSMIIILSDHGEFLGERNLLSHGLTLYHEELSIPLIIKLPFSSVTGINQKIFTINYLFDYIISYLNNKASCSSNKNFEAEYYLAERYGVKSNEIVELKKNNKLALFISDYKVIFNKVDDIEVFNLALDPKETKDIKKTHQELVNWGKTFYEKIFLQEKKKEFILSPEIQKKLKTLGYLR